MCQLQMKLINLHPGGTMTAKTVDRSEWHELSVTFNSHAQADTTGDDYGENSQRSGRQG